MKILFCILTISSITVINAQIPRIADLLQQFEEYKVNFNKTYLDISTEAYARFCYRYNKLLINAHNALYERGLRTYSLRENQFTDMRLLRFNALFPETRPLSVAYNSTPANTSEVPIAEYLPEINLTISDQGKNCNSGWAYAAVKSIELFQAYITGNLSPAELSAQNLIDCAGTVNACRNQVPQTAFDYLTQYNQELHLASDYRPDPNNTQQGMCVMPLAPTVTTTLSSYAMLDNGDDDALMAYVSEGYPVVVEFNPTSFEFMHYGEGVFKPPTLQRRGSHFMVVIGYGTDDITGLNYWLLQNSFGEDWGELGLMKVARTAESPITKNAIFPLEL